MVQAIWHDMHEDKFLIAAQGMVGFGLKDAGYEVGSPPEARQLGCAQGLDGRVSALAGVYWYGDHGAPPDTVRSAERCNRMGDVLCKHEGDFSVLYTGAMHMLNRRVTSWHVWRDIVPQWAGREQWSWRFSSNIPQATRQSQQTVNSANPQPRHFLPRVQQFLGPQRPRHTGGWQRQPAAEGTRTRFALWGVDTLSFMNLAAGWYCHHCLDEASQPSINT